MWRELLMVACALCVNIAPLQGTEGAVSGAPAAGLTAAVRQAGGDGPSAVFWHLNASVVLNETGHSMDVSLRISMVTAKNTSSLLFGLNVAMDIQAISEEGFGALSYRWVPWTSWVNVSLGRTLPAQTALNITVDYGGSVQNSQDGGQTFWDYIGPEGSWVRTYGKYFPCDEELTRTTCRLCVTLPQDKVVAAAGALVGNWTDASNGTATYVWDERQAIKGISFAAGRLNLTTVSPGQRSYNVFFRQDHGTSAQGYASELDRARGFYGALMGAPGFGNLTVVELPDTYAAWGQTVPSMIWLASRNFAGPFPYRLLAHEMAHQWWGVDVEGREYFDNWLQEGFAGYCEALYEMAVYGSRGYLDYCRTQYINTYVQSGSTEPALISNDYDISVYKGPWVLHMLKYLAGGPAFDRTLLDFHRNFTGRLAAPADFVSSAMASTGLDLWSFFDFWFNTSGRLDYALGGPVIYKGPGSIDRLCVTVENRGRATGLPADIGFYDSEGGRISFISRAWNASASNASLAFDLDYAVDTVVLDPDEWLLDVYPSNNEAPTRRASLDFGIEGLWLSPAEPEENQICVLNISMSSSSTEGPNTVEYEILVDGVLAGNASTDLQATQKATAYFQMALPGGAHVLTVVLDPQGDHYEVDAANNIARLNVTVRPWQPPRPDIRVLAGNIGVAPQSAVGGEMAELTALVENIGTVDASNITLTFRVDSDGETLRTGGLSLPAGNRSPVSVPWTALPGWHEVTVSSEPGPEGDADSSNNGATGLIYINTRPYAMLSASVRDVGPGDWVELSGASSTDDGGVAYYFFDFGDGETTGWMRESSSWHSYAGRGAYQARLRVQDWAGAESDWSDPVTIRVRDAPPAASISAVPRVGYAGTVFHFSSLARDGEGNLTAHAWAFGDGKSKNGETVNHSYATHGDFLVTLTVTGASGLTSTASTTVKVLDMAPMPAISLNRTSALVGEHFGFSAGGSSDPDDPPSALIYRWDFGDGQMAFGPQASYAFRRPGEYRVVLLVSDGNLSAERSTTVLVRLPVQSPQTKGPGWQSWAVLGALLLAMALLVISMMIPGSSKDRHDEEE
jgi:PKD repeat protein/catechol 2,3-dioxygenase-like lactoylglutathione lyase family enzyme